MVQIIREIDDAWEDHHPREMPVVYINSRTSSHERTSKAMTHSDDKAIGVSQHLL